MTLIIGGILGATGALIPIIFGDREITYVFSGDRFSYPGSISACLFVVGVLSLFKYSLLKYIFSFILISVSLLTQYTNNYTFKLNYEQTNSTWWQLSWRAPEIKPTTLITGQIQYGINDEDYTFWGPANLIYYPGEKDLQITAEVLDNTTKSIFLAQQHDIYTRKTITFERDFSNLLVIVKAYNSCLHVINGEHPEYSEFDKPYLQEIGLLSKLDLINVESKNTPFPRMDLFGPEPTKDWCYFYQKAQLERQRGNWNQVTEYGLEVLQKNLNTVDPMEWLVFAQAFAYTSNPNYSVVKKQIFSDPYACAKACEVFSSYSEETKSTSLQEGQSQLLVDFCH